MKGRVGLTLSQDILSFLSRRTTNISLFTFTLFAHNELLGYQRRGPGEYQLFNRMRVWEELEWRN